jgi:nitrite reductase (NADH) small subunit
VQDRAKSRARPRRFVVGSVESIPPGTVKHVRPDPDEAEIGVFNIAGEFYALRSYCPHMGAPLCRGRITGTTEPSNGSAYGRRTVWVRDGEIITCPWHRWEFDIKTGRTVFPSRNRAKRYDVSVELDARRVETYPVVVQAGEVILHLSGGGQPAPEARKEGPDDR